MKAIMFKRAIILFSTLALITMMGFAQDQKDERKELAEKAGISLTDSMTYALALTTSQIDSVGQCNLTYTYSIFTTDPLTDKIVKKIEENLDSCLKDILRTTQYDIWIEKRKGWLDSVKKNLVIKEEEEEEVPTPIDEPYF